MKLILLLVGYLRSRFGRWTVLSLSLALVLMSLSLINYSSVPVRHEARRVQKALISRERILQDYVDRALAVSPNEWVSFNDFPEDMVIYKYCADTIQSWVNRFPINNDEVDLTPLWYHLNDMNSLSLYNTPLAYLAQGEQYVNLGSAWYIVKVCRSDNAKIVAGILVKTEYVTENTALRNSVNAKLLLKSKYDTVPIYVDDGNVVFGSDGSPLFSVVDKSPLSEPVVGTVMKWISLIVLLVSVFSFHTFRRNYQSLLLTLAVLVCSMIACPWLIKALSLNIPLFSPTLYADSFVFDSLGEMLILHLLVFLSISAVFMCRKRYLRMISGASAARKWVVRLILILIILVYIIYIHLSLRSVILNSNIVLELFKIDDLSFWTFIVYVAYGFLFMGLLLLIYVGYSLFRKKSKVKILSWKWILIYVGLITAYCFTMVTVFSFRKEYIENRIWTDRLSVDRDLTLEMQLRAVEKQIAVDPILRILLRMDRPEQAVVSRIVDQYMWNVTQKYEISATICSPGDQVLTENYPKPVDCHQFFERQIIGRYGVQLSPESFSWYVNNYQNVTSYVGWWTYIVDGVPVDLYLEIDAKPTADGAIGYPALLLDSRSRSRGMIQSHYSYAKYYEGKLVSSSGEYGYSMTFRDMDVSGHKYSYRRENGYIHFSNHTSSDGIVVMSRSLRGWHQYLMSLSYLYLIFGIVIFVVVYVIRKRNDKGIVVPVRRTFRRKITVLLTASLLFALAVMGIGSIIFILHLSDTTDRTQMQEKMKTVQSSLSVFFRYAGDYREINNLNMFNAMDGVSANAKVDINLYDPHGSLIRSTKPEIFTKYLASSRMEPGAFASIVYGERLMVIQKESIADMEYYSLYAPVFNEKGNIIAVINIPFFLDRSGFRQGNAPFIIASIINIYLLLLIFTLFGGATMANAISRPITQISRRMQELNISQEPHHLNYKQDDELGVLIRSYNHMVDDVKKSTLQLAQSEREQAWREMARQIAHEIKNPLTPMKLSIQYLMRMKKMNVPGWEDRLDALSESLIEQIDILSDTASEFSSFAKFYNEEDSEFDLMALLNEQMLLFDNREKVSLEFRCDLESAPVKLKKSQITRAFVNIISNAFQALEDIGGGKVRVTLRRFGDVYRVDVEDDGTGVSEENLDKLFKPNFTTKSSGTGLGLAITRNVVEQSRGRIWYETSELGGAEFSMELPSA